MMRSFAALAVSSSLWEGVVEGWAGSSVVFSTSYLEDLYAFSGRLVDILLGRFRIFFLLTYLFYLFCILGFLLLCWLGGLGSGEMDCWGLWRHSIKDMHLVHNVEIHLFSKLISVKECSLWLYPVSWTSLHSSVKKWVQGELIEDWQKMENH